MKLESSEVLMQRTLASLLQSLPKKDAAFIEPMEYAQAQKSTLMYGSGIRRNVKKSSMWACRAESMLKEINARKKDKG